MVKIAASMNALPPPPPPRKYATLGGVDHSLPVNRRGVVALVHASCVAVDGIGVLIRGPSGSGKSDLALRLIAGGADLVCDCYCELSVVAGRLIARAPET